jgi:hypothetical protein
MDTGHVVQTGERINTWIILVGYLLEDQTIFVRISLRWIVGTLVEGG